MEVIANDNSIRNVSEPLGNAVNLAQTFIAAKQELEKSLSNAGREFRDARLQQERKRIEDELAKLRTDTMAAISAHFDDVPDGMAQFSEFVQSMVAPAASIFRRPF